MTTSAEDPATARRDRPDPSAARRLIVFGVVVLIAGVLLTWLLFLVRSTLTTIYISLSVAHTDEHH